MCELVSIGHSIKKRSPSQALSAEDRRSQDDTMSFCELIEPLSERETLNPPPRAS